MKTMNRILAAASAILLLAACNYEYLNTNRFEMTDEMGARDGIALGGSITAMEKCVFPVGTTADGTDIINAYQTAFNLSADTWCGYFGQNNRWNSGQNNCAYYLVDSWCANTYAQTYTNLLSSWKKIKEEATKLSHSEWTSLADIIRISAWSKTLESFGPIPYTHAGEAALVIPSDSEETVFKEMLKDLSNAVDILSPLAGSRLFADYDAVYGGDVTKWVKYANSLMLRLAMRVSYADESLATEYALKAVNSKLGLMTTVEDAAQMSKGAGMSFVNNIEYLASKYGETRMGVSIFCYLNGYKDPRLEKYFTESTTENAVTAYNGKKYVGISGGSKKGMIDSYTTGSLPNFTPETPTYWMKTSEVYFLLAEASLRFGNEFGSAESLYKEGIKMSFIENGISSSSVDAYLAVNAAPSGYEFGSSYSVASTATSAFTGSTNEKLEKIAIQKYLALYPNGHEAWTEWRRTGFPKLAPIEENNGSGEGVTLNGGIRRMKYPVSFRQSAEDQANYYKTLELLGGDDKPTTQLWWDCHVKAY